MSVGARKSKKVFFCNIYFVRDIFLVFAFFFQYITYWINFMISYLTSATQPLDTQNIRHFALNLLIRETRNFWSPPLLVHLACKCEKLLFQKWDGMVLY